MNTATVSTSPDFLLSQTGPANEARPTPPTPHGATLANFALFDLGVLQLSPQIRDLGKITS
jgi:hypothetical protein